MTTPLPASTVTLVSRLSHDFNNLFSVVLGGLSLLRDELGEQGLDPELEAVLDDVLSATHDASQVIDKLTAWAGRQIVEPRSVDLNEVAQALCADLSTSMPPRIRCTLARAPQPARAWVDPAKLHECLHLVVSNAIEAIEREGEITVEVRAGSAPAITVFDSGMGMRPELLKRCTEPYVSTRHDQGHRGLGLSVVEGFMRVSEGLLTFESAEGEGTRVTLEFTPPERIAAQD